VLILKAGYSDKRIF